MVPAAIPAAGRGPDTKASGGAERVVTVAKSGLESYYGAQVHAARGAKYCRGHRAIPYEAIT